MFLNNNNLRLYFWHEHCINAIFKINYSFKPKTNMNKLFIIAILGLLTTGAFAQTNQGTKVVSGSVGFNKSSDDRKYQNGGTYDYSSVLLEFDPSFGYFIKDKLEVGVSVGYGYQKYDAKENNESESGYKHEYMSNIYSFNPYIKRYFHVTEKIALSGSLAAGFRTGKSKQTTESDFTSTIESNSTGYFARLTPGISFFPTDKIGLRASFGNLGYTYLSSEYENGGAKITSQNLGFNLDSNAFGVGFSYHF